MVSHIKEYLREYPEVLECTSNPETGSFLIRYEPKANSDESITALLSATGLHIDAGANGESAFLRTEASAIGQRIGEFMRSLDTALFYRSGQSLDLRTLYPLTLGTLGVYLIARNGLMLSQMPGLVLLMQAIAAFQRHHAWEEPDVGC
jgi:hypothetical protein